MGCHNKAASPQHSRIRQMAPVCTPYTESQKMVAVATSPMCKVLAISLFCRPTTQTPSITSCLVAVVLTKRVIAILVPQLVAMTTTIRHSISSIFSSDSLTPKAHPLEPNSLSLAIIQPKLLPISKATEPVMTNCVQKLVPIATTVSTFGLPSNTRFLGPIQAKRNLDWFSRFGRPLVNRFALCDRTVVLSVCPVCDVGALWPNSWMDQDETWHAGKPRPWPHCVRWEPSSAPQKRRGAPPQFSAHVHCGQIAGRIKMALGMEVGLRPGHSVLDGDPAPSPKKGRAPSQIFGPFLLWPNGWMHQDATWYGGRPQPRRLCVRWDQPPTPKGADPPNFWPTSIVAKRLHGSRCHLVSR